MHWNTDSRLHAGTALSITALSGTALSGTARVCAARCRAFAGFKDAQVMCVWELNCPGRTVLPATVVSVPAVVAIVKDLFRIPVALRRKKPVDIANLRLRLRKSHQATRIDNPKDRAHNNLPHTHGIATLRDSFEWFRNESR